MLQYGFHFGHFGPPWSSQKLSGRPPKASLDLDRRPESSPKRNPSFSYNKTTHLEDLVGHLGTPNKPQPPPPVKLSFDNAPYTSSVNDPTRRHPGSADSEGLRPHAPTLEKRSQPNASFTQNPKLELNPKVEIERPISKRQTPSPNSQLKTQTELWISPRSIFSCGTH